MVRVLAAWLNGQVARFSSSNIFFFFRALKRGRLFLACIIFASRVWRCDVVDLSPYDMNAWWWWRMLFLLVAWSMRMDCGVRPVLLGVFVIGLTTTLSSRTWAILIVVTNWGWIFFQWAHCSTRRTFFTCLPVLFSRFFSVLIFFTPSSEKGSIRRSCWFWMRQNYTVTYLRPLHLVSIFPPNAFWLIVTEFAWCVSSRGNVISLKCAFHGGFMYLRSTRNHCLPILRHCFSFVEIHIVQFNNTK